MPSNRVRVDKWLWSVRIFKSRSKATAACKNGKVKLGDIYLKPSSLIEVGHVIALKKDGFNLQFKVLKLLEKRVGYAIAQDCYENITPLEELNKFKDWFIGKAPAERRDRGAGRPTKRQRRELDQFKDEIYLDEWFEGD